MIYIESDLNLIHIESIFCPIPIDLLRHLKQIRQIKDGIFIRLIGLYIYVGILIYESYVY